MTMLLTVGDWSGRSEYITHLTRAGYLVGWADPSAEPQRKSPGFHPVGLLAVLDSRSDVAATAELARRLETPWLAWDCGAGTSLEAYRDGVAAVLTREISPTELAEAVAM